MIQDNFCITTSTICVTIVPYYKIVLDLQGKEKMRNKRQVMKQEIGNETEETKFYEIGLVRKAFDECFSVLKYR